VVVSTGGCLVSGGMAVTVVVPSCVVGLMVGVQPGVQSTLSLLLQIPFT